jgi:anti-sigma regulatory factor (Ser/Thr protein kinase)
MPWPVASPISTISLPSARRDFVRSFDALGDLFAFVDAALDDSDADADARYAIRFAFEELFTNMIKYNPRGAGPITLEIACDGGAALCSLADPDSDRFDMTAAPDADIHAPAVSRRPGGLGLHLVRRLVDSVAYDYSGRCSRVTFRKTLESA